MNVCDIVLRSLHQFVNHNGYYIDKVRPHKTMLQDAQSVRYYQRITDSLVDHWNRGYRTDELRLFLEGYLSALRHADALEPYLINRLEEETIRFLLDPSNFYEPQVEPDRDYF